MIYPINTPLTAREAMEQVGHIGNGDLTRAVSLAFWLIIEKGRPLKQSITIASNKHEYKPKSDIETLVRSGLPQSYFANRAYDLYVA